MAPAETLLRFKNIKEIVVRYNSRLSDVKPPAEIYEEKKADIRGRITQLWESLASASAPETFSLQEKVVELGGQLRELEISYQANLQDEEKVYDQELRGVLDALCYELLEVITLPDIESYLQNVSSGEHIQQVSHDETDEHQGTPKSSPPSPTKACTRGKRNRDSSKLPANKRQRADEHHQAKSKKPVASSSAARPSLIKTRLRRTRYDGRGSISDQSLVGITDPSPGNVYLAFWEKSKEWLAVLLLPTEDLQSVGVPGSIESLGLAEVLPQCYRKDEGKMCWAKGYNDGEPLISRREFPIMYFDGQEFPAKSTVGWVSAKDLQTFDAKDANPLIPHIQSVRKFLKAQEENRLLDQEAHRSKPGSESDVPDATEQLSTEAENSSPPPPEAPCRPFDAQTSSADQGKARSASSPATPLTVSSTSHAALSGPSSQPRLLLGFHDVQLREPSVYGSAVHLNTTPDLRLGNDLVESCHTNVAGSITAPGKVTRTGLIESSGVDRTLYEPVQQSDTTPRKSLPANLTFEPPATPKIHLMDSTLERPSLSDISPAAPTHIAPTRVTQQQSVRSETRNSPSIRPIVDVACPIVEELQTCRTSNRTENTNEISDVAVIGMLQLRPPSRDPKHPHSSRAGILCKSKVPESMPVLPPIGSMLQGGVDVHLTHPTLGQVPSQVEQRLSLQASSVQKPTNASSPPASSPPASSPPASSRSPPHTWLSTTTPARRSPISAVLSSQTPITHHAPHSLLQARSGDSFPTQVAFSSAMTDQRRPSSPATLASCSHDGHEEQHSHGPDATSSRGLWYKSLPQDLIELLESYQRDHRLSLGIQGLRVQSGHYICPFCDHSRRKLYTRPSPFLNHVQKHWSTIMQNK